MMSLKNKKTADKRTQCTTPKKQSIDGNDTTTVLRYVRFHHQDRLGIDRLLPARCRVCVCVCTRSSAEL